MAKKWMFLWSVIAAILLWRTAVVADSRPLLSFLTKTTLSEESTTSVSDQLAHPPLSQSFTTGEYHFVVSAVDEWQTPAAMGALYKGDRLVWENELPHQYGPRFVVVGEQGQVLLADEFINVASPYALRLLDSTGEPIATYAFEDIHQALSIPAATLTQQATSGWWISAAPQLAEAERSQAESDIAEETVLISTGGTQLAVNLLTGELTPHQDL